ncbi:MAG TPA: aldehyde ferredoxin oxidoreductase family protein [Atribacterota bacterium]|nr:aldehyde ferredoxin oxidoreductase family protein [Atribacterota bacterium]
MDFLGKVLHIDLNNKKTWIEEIKREDWMKFLPGRGLAAKLLWDLTDEKTDPLGNNNVLIFSTGGFTGSILPCSGRTTVTFKSPATNMYFKSNVGGKWGAELKFTGYGYLVIHGKADSPIYIYINNDKVYFKDATLFWGKDVRETNRLIQEEINDSSVELATIGPAGENLVLISSVMFSTYSAAARGGIGAVMGSKNLKAIAVKGNKKIELNKNEKIKELATIARKSIRNDSGFKGLSRYGTAGSVISLTNIDCYPSRNFQHSRFIDAEKISGEVLLESGRLTKSTACYSCIIGCHRFTKTLGHKYDGFAGGPELETISSFGIGPEVNDFDAIVKANELCNIYGLDTISTGSVIQWAMECYEKGIISKKDTGGIELKFGNGEAVVQMIEKIAYRDGFGDILAQGVRRAAQKVGSDSWKWAIEAKGLEQSCVDTRVAKGYALAFAVNPRGADHLHTETFAELGLSEEGRELIKRIMGSDKFIGPTTTVKRAAIVRWHEDCYAASDALGFCVFTNTALYGLTPKMMAEMWSIAIGEDVSEEELMEAGRRIITLEKAYNVRCGATRSEDTLPWRIMNEGVKDREGRDFIVTSQKELDEMLDEYYKLHGWDLKTSWPTRKVLEKLDLGFIVEEFRGKEKL